MCSFLSYKYKLSIQAHFKITVLISERGYLNRICQISEYLTEYPYQNLRTIPTKIVS